MKNTLQNNLKNVTYISIYDRLIKLMKVHVHAQVKFHLKCFNFIVCFR